MCSQPCAGKPTRTGLRRQFPEVVTPLIMDLLDEDSVRAAAEVVSGHGPLFGLVNNAGAAFPGPLELIPIEVFRRQLEINLTAQLLVTQVMLPALRRSAEAIGDARIIMIGSIGGRIAGPMLGAYSAAKHGLVGLSGSLRAELAPSKIKVVLIEPGAIATPIWDRGTSHWRRTAIDRPRGMGTLRRPARGAPKAGAAQRDLRPRSGGSGQDHPGSPAERKSSSATSGWPGRQADGSNGSSAAVPSGLQDRQGPTLTPGLSCRSRQWHAPGSSRTGSCPGTAGGSPPRSRTRRQGRSRW